VTPTGPDISAGPGIPLGLEGYGALRTSAAARRIPRDVLIVSGPDAISFLQGQASQDVAGLAAGATADTLLLSPQGKVDAYLRVTRTGDERLVLDVDAGFGPVVEARLRRFMLRVKVDVEVPDWTCTSVRGPDASGAVIGRPELVLAVEWPGLSGFDLLGPTGGDGGSNWVDPSVERCGLEAWEAVRIEAGVPMNGRELTGSSIAAEVGLVERTVSFTKGCFTGQELVARLDSRGSKVARRLAGVVLGSGDPAARPPVGSVVMSSDGEHQVGLVSSVAWSPGFGSYVGLAAIHRRVEPPEPVSVRWSDGDADRGLEARALPLPMTPVA
jgi:folate-binding protein YgfZ